MKTIVVIPTYNEISNIKNIINAVLEAQEGVHILVVDDNSPDGTAEVVNEMKAMNDSIHLLKRAGKMGLGTAYCDGFRYCLERDYEAIFEMDADFSHDPKEIPNFLAALKDNDLVIGSRYIKGFNVVNWPLSRLVLSYGAGIYTRIITGMKIMDVTGGFKCFRADSLRKIDLSDVHSNGYGFQIEMNFRMQKSGARIKEIPITFTDRTSGVSKMSKSIIYEAIFLVWKLRFSGNKFSQKKLNK